MVKSNVIPRLVTIIIILLSLLQMEAFAEPKPLCELKCKIYDKNRGAIEIEITCESGRVVHQSKGDDHIKYYYDDHGRQLGKLIIHRAQGKLTFENTRNTYDILERTFVDTVNDTVSYRIMVNGRFFENTPQYCEKYNYIQSSNTNQSTIESFIAAIENKDVRVRREAVWALAGLEDNQLIKIKLMMKALKDSDPGVRWIATGMLEEINDICAVEPLITALKDESKDVRSRAARALKEITGKDFGENNKKWWEWWEENKEKFRSSR